jgi:ligand-binding sensor domain-containing protein
MKKLPLFILLLIGMSFQANAQTCTSLLQQNEIRSSIKSGSCIWSATNGGLVKFDTATYEKTYFTKENSGLPQNAVRKIAADASGNFWMTTDGGLVIKYDGINFTSFDLSTQFSLPQRYIGGLTIVGNKIHVTAGDKILSYNGTSWTSATVSYSGSKTIFSIQGIQAYQTNIFLSVLVYEIIGVNAVYNIHYVKFDGTTFTLLKAFDHDNGGINSANNVTGDFIFDNQGNFWIARYEGAVFKMDKITLAVTTFVIPNSVRNCPNLYITVMVFMNNNLYFGGAGKNGLIVLDITTTTWSSINDSNSLMPRSDVMAIVFISPNTLYMGNQIELVRVSISDKQCVVRNLNYNAGKFDFWASYHFDVIGSNVYFSGGKYFGANDSLRVLNTETSSWSTYKDYGGYFKLANKFVKDNSGKLWLCSYYGLYYFETGANKWTQYTAGSADTLMDVHNMAFDKNNNLWVIAGEDLIKINAVGVMKKIYKIQQAGQFNALCYDKSNHIYATAGVSTTEAIVKISIIDDAITYLKNDNYNYTLQYVDNIQFANDTIYYSNNKTIGKIHNSQLVRKFETSDYVSPIVRRAPISSLQSFCVDRAGKIWMVDQNFNKIVVYDGTNYQTYDYNNSCLSTTMYSIVCDEYNRKWVKADGLYRIEDNTMTTDINEVVANNFEGDVFVYPNPLSSQAQVQLPEYSAPVKSIAVLDMKSSETAAVRDYSILGNQIQLNLSFLKQGVYILRVTTEDDKERNLKFVKVQ